MFETSLKKVRKQIFGLLTNRFGFGCSAILTLQQLVEASSTLWLVLVMQKITSGDPFFNYLLLYLFSIMAAYVLLCFAYVWRISWKQEALKSFINAFVGSNRNQIAEWSHKGLKEEKLAILTAEAPSAINLLIDYLFDVYSYVISVFFNIIALSIVVEPLFSVAYALSVSGVVLVMIFKRKMQRQLTKKALTARVDLTQSLLAAWDNVLLGNHYNFKLWQEKTSQRVNRSIQRNVHLERFDQIMAVLVSLMTSIPFLLVVIYFAWTHRADPVKLSSFIVTLPILFMILSYTYQTLSLVFRWGMHKSKLLALYKAIQPIKEDPLLLADKVKWDKITLMNETLTPNDKISLASPYHATSTEELIAKTGSIGRITLRGENGSGKSTLLMLIKHALQNKAFILPTHSQLSFVSETNKHSTGESLKRRLVEILEKVDVEVLLLDEWDANLDKENRETLSLLIDEIAKKKCVIEVRHR